MHLFDTENRRRAENICNAFVKFAPRSDAAELIDSYQAREDFVTGAARNSDAELAELEAEAQRCKTAVHEASHACIALVEGVEVTGATIKRDGDRFGVCYCSLAEAPLVKAIRVLLAGAIGTEEEFSLAADHAWGDRQKLFEKISEYAEEQRMWNRENLTEDKAMSVAYSFWDTTRDDLYSHWRFVKAMASELLDKEEMSGDEIYELWEDCGY